MSFQAVFLALSVFDCGKPECHPSMESGLVFSTPWCNYIKSTLYQIYRDHDLSVCFMGLECLWLWRTWWPLLYKLFLFQLTVVKPCLINSATSFQKISINCRKSKLNPMRGVSSIEFRFILKYVRAYLTVSAYANVLEI